MQSTTEADMSGRDAARGRALAIVAGAALAVSVVVLVVAVPASFPRTGAAGYVPPAEWAGTALLAGAGGAGLSLLALLVHGLRTAGRARAVRAARAEIDGPAGAPSAGTDGTAWWQEGRMYWPATSLDGRAEYVDGRWRPSERLRTTRLVTVAGFVLLVLLGAALLIATRTSDSMSGTMALSLAFPLLTEFALPGLVVWAAFAFTRPRAPLGPHRGRFWWWTPPPGWPVPDGFVPTPGWQPDPSWPDAPPQWRGWRLVTVPSPPPPPVWPPTPRSVQDGTFAHDGVLWWPLLTPDGSRPLAPGRAERVTALALPVVGGLLVALAPMLFALAGLMSMGDPGPESFVDGKYIASPWPPRVMIVALVVGVVGLAVVAAAWRLTPRRGRPRLVHGGFRWVWSPPPGWPTPADGFTPEPGWRPDPSWPAPPPDWRGWTVALDDGPRR